MDRRQREASKEIPRRPTLQDLRQAIEELAEYCATCPVEVRQRALVEDVEAFRSDVHRLVVLLSGDEGIEFTGLMERVKRLESMVEQMHDEREAMEHRVKGIMIGLGLTGLTGAGTLLTVLTRTLGVD